MRELYGRSRRTVALALALVLLLTLLLSAAFMLLEVGHTCHGAHCAVCERILMLQGLLHQLGLLALAPGENTLLVRVSGLAAYQPGFGTVGVGDPATLAREYREGVFKRYEMRLINFAMNAVLGPTSPPSAKPCSSRNAITRIGASTPIEA